MQDLSEWRKWILYHMIGEGIHKIMFEEDIIKEAGRHYDINLERALRSLIDEGIIMLLESNKKRKFIVNFDRLIDAQNIINSIHIETKNELKKNVIQPFLSEPNGYVFWFDNKEERQFKKQNVYRIYFKETDKMNFAAQLLTKSMSNPKVIHMGSLNEPYSVISRLWRAVLLISEEKKDNGFILQDIQDKDRIACGNNRQRGKIALIIFKKLGYIQSVEFKGNSTKFKLAGKKPYTLTLDEIFDFSS